MINSEAFSNMEYAWTNEGLNPLIMGGHDSGSQHQFTGMARYFNSYTMVGRRNCVLATYAALLGIGLFFKLKPKKAAVTEK